jgi:hypothetical protein
VGGLDTGPYAEGGHPHDVLASNQPGVLDAARAGGGREAVECGGHGGVTDRVQDDL